MSSLFPPLISFDTKMDLDKSIRGPLNECFLKKTKKQVTIETEWNGIKMESTGSRKRKRNDQRWRRFSFYLDLKFSSNSWLSRVTRKIHRVQTWKWYRILLVYQILSYLLHTTVVAPRAFHRSSWPSGHESGKGNFRKQLLRGKSSIVERTPKSGHVIFFVFFGSSTIENFGDLEHDRRVYDFLDEQDKRITVF